MNKNQTEQFFATLKSKNPVPKGELDYINPFTLLVAVVLSAQSTDVGVNKAAGPLFKVVDSPEKMVKLGIDKLKDYIKTIGLYNTKAKNVIRLSEMLVEQYGSQVPEDRAELERLPGVGRKTANVVLNTAFGHPTIAVDTHLFRVSNRTGMAPGKNPLEVELNLLKVIPEHYLKDAHHWLILHGRYICKARKPECYNCPVSDLCEYEAKTIS